MLLLVLVLPERQPQKQHDDIEDGIAPGKQHAIAVGNAMDTKIHGLHAQQGNTFVAVHPIQGLFLALFCHEATEKWDFSCLEKG